MFVKDQQSLVSALQKTSEQTIQTINGQILGDAKSLAIKSFPALIRIDSSTPQYHEFQVINQTSETQPRQLEIDFSLYSNEETQSIISVKTKGIYGFSNQIVNGNRVLLEVLEKSIVRMIFYTSQSVALDADKNEACLQFPTFEIATLSPVNSNSS